MNRPTLVRLALWSPAIILAVALTGCAGAADRSSAPVNSSSETAPSAPATSAPATSAPASSAPESSAPPAATSTTPIVLEIGGQQISGELDDSATSASLVAQLPLTLSFSDHGGQEKIATLPTPLSLDGAPDRSNATPLMIGYYSPSQGLVLYYDNVGTYAGIIPIGSFDNLDAVRNPRGDFTITIRQAS